MRLLRRTPGDRSARRWGGAAVATIAVDTLGADRGVAEVVAGALEGTRAGTRCVLIGPRAEIEPALDELDRSPVELVDTSVGISNSEEPAQAVRAKPDASVVLGAQLVAAGRADALVSAGATGAALAASLLFIKRLSGVYRPAVAVPLPVPGRRLLLLDVGANIEVRPEHLVQFAFMGAAFSERVLGIPEPRVGLLSVGEEPNKGTADVVEANARLAETDLNFAGNVEGGDLAAGAVDVVVTDGFTGNVVLKAMEGTAALVGGAIRDAITSGRLSKLGGLLVRSRLAALRGELSIDAVGGAYLLGLRKPVVICHGSSSQRAIANAVAIAERGVAERVVGKTHEALVAAGIARAGERVASASVADSLEVR